MSDDRQIRINVGDKVRVWPAPGAKVRERADAHRSLPDGGKDVVWSAWLSSKLSTGEIYVTDPAPPKAPPAKPVKE